MNRSFIVAVLTVTMIIMMSTAGHALTAPHNLACDNCHGKFIGSPVATASANSCIGCHSSQGEAPRMPVEADAMSNYFGSATGQPATGSRSTHTWGAYSAPGHPYNKAAMVHEPTVSDINWGYPSTQVSRTSNTTIFVGTTLCNRCHDVKNTNTNKPFLRTTLTIDALCADCHRDRNQGSSAIVAGTHPVNYRAYSSVYKSNTTAFRKEIVSANPFNPTANPGNYLSANKIVCRTCHAPHYADSNSATLDNRSTANGFAQDDPAKGLKGQLQNSKGQLLRTDPIGATANAINICSSCHKETANMNHNGKGQNIQCDHCHAAHVDYTGDASLPNLNLVRRDFSNMSTVKVKLGANVKVIYNTATSLRFKRADGKGICQVCHTPTPGVAIHDLGDTRKEDCIVCHKHSTGFAAADCASCHGQPPVSSYVGGPKGKASQNYPLDETFTPHVTHADAGYYKYDCKNCHYEGTKAGYHNTGSSFTDVFIDTTGSVGDQAGLTKNVPADYNNTSKTCSNVYCHSNGNPRGGTIAWKSAETPSWENGKNAILGQAAECTTCHESGATLVSNAHFKHATTNNISCFVCHAATVTPAGSIADRTKHANGSKDVVFVTRPANFQSVFTASFNTGDATCTASCHTNGLGGNPVLTPKWTDLASGQCGSCHAAVPATSLHSMHFTDIVGPKLGTAPTVCANCHDYSAGAATHANGVVNLNAGNSCAPCHPGGAPIWSTSATVTCESCHTGTASVVGAYTAPLQNLTATLGHGQYSSVALAKVKCTTCHNPAADHIGATDKRLLIAGNGLCDSCHTTAAGKGLPEERIDLPAHGGSVNKFFHYTSADDLVNIATVRPDSCAGCHDTHGTSNKMSIRTVINGQPVAAYTGTTPNFIVLTPNGGVYNGLCQVCHTKTKYFNRNSAPVTSHATGECLTCHKHKASHFAFEPSGGCNACHGYPPVRDLTGLGTMANYSYAKLQDYSGGGGAHTVAGHIPKTAVASQLWTNCTNCHYDTANHAKGGTPAKKSFVNVVVDPQFKFNNATSITYNANSCSNVSCHFRPSPNWTNGL